MKNIKEIKERPNMQDPLIKYTLEQLETYRNSRTELLTIDKLIVTPQKEHYVTINGYQEIVLVSFSHPSVIKANSNQHLKMLINELQTKYRNVSQYKTYKGGRICTLTPWDLLLPDDGPLIEEFIR